MLLFITDVRTDPWESGSNCKKTRKCHQFCQDGFSGAPRSPPAPGHGWRLSLLAWCRRAVPVLLGARPQPRAGVLAGATDPSPQSCSQEMSRGDRVHVEVERNPMVVFLTTRGLGGQESASATSPVSPTGLCAGFSLNTPDVVCWPW